MHGQLTLKAPIKTAADDIHKYFFHCFSEKIRPDVSNESHEKIKPCFLRKIKVKKCKCRLLQVLFGALRVKVCSDSLSLFVLAGCSDITSI